MSTRANVVIKDDNTTLYFYRHSDGYPEGTLPSLNKFMDWLEKGLIRDNTTQAAGWLIILGAIEYSGSNHDIDTPSDIKLSEYCPDKEKWKVGAYEPANEFNGDIDYLYTIDLKRRKLDICEVQGTKITPIRRAVTSERIETL